MSNEAAKPGLISRLSTWGLRQWAYCSEGVWSDTRRNWRVNVIKTLNLSVRSFLDRDLQSQAAALTFKTLLAIVPALALFFAVLNRSCSIISLLRARRSRRRSRLSTAI